MTFHTSFGLAATWELQVTKSAKFLGKPSKCGFLLFPKLRVQLIFDFIQLYVHDRRKPVTSGHTELTCSRIHGKGHTIIHSSGQDT